MIRAFLVTVMQGAVYKSGTGTRGRGHRDACVGTWDLGTRDEGLEDIKYGTRGRVGRERGEVKYRDAQPRPQGAFPWLCPKAREKRPGDEVEGRRGRKM